MLLVAGKIITPLSVYFLSLLCSVLFFHSFCQDQHCYLHSGDQLLLLYNSIVVLHSKGERALVPSLCFWFLLFCGSCFYLAWCHKCAPLQGIKWQMWKAGDSHQLCTSLEAAPSPTSSKGQGVSFPHVAGHVGQSFTTSCPLRDCSLPLAIQ